MKTPPSLFVTRYEMLTRSRRYESTFDVAEITRRAFAGRRRICPLDLVGRRDLSKLERCFLLEHWSCRIAPFMTESDANRETWFSLALAAARLAVVREVVRGLRRVTFDRWLDRRVSVYAQRTNRDEFLEHLANLRDYLIGGRMKGRYYFEQANRYFWSSGAAFHKPVVADLLKRARNATQSHFFGKAVAAEDFGRALVDVARRPHKYARELEARAAARRAGVGDFAPEGPEGAR